MKAVILAAGKGTRMRELTAEMPKPMLKVHGKPILEHIVEGIMQAGIRDFCIITGFKAETRERLPQRPLPADYVEGFGEGKVLAFP